MLEGQESVVFVEVHWIPMDDIRRRVMADVGILGIVTFPTAVKRNARGSPQPSQPLTLDRVLRAYLNCTSLFQKRVRKSACAPDQGQIFLEQFREAYSKDRNPYVPQGGSGEHGDTSKGGKPLTLVFSACTWSTASGNSPRDHQAATVGTAWYHAIRLLPRQLHVGKSVQNPQQNLHECQIKGERFWSLA